MPVRRPELGADVERPKGTLPLDAVVEGTSAPLDYAARWSLWSWLNHLDIWFQFGW